MAKDSITINPNRRWVDLLRLKEPALFDHGNNYAIECVIADRLNLHRPRTPTEARKQGAKIRGKQLQGKPALNPAGRVGKGKVSKK